MNGNMNNHNETIQVCALVPYPVDTTPSQRFRIEQWRPYLKENGISVDLVPFADKDLLQLLHQPGRRVAKLLAGAARFARRFVDIASIPRYDAVLIHRAICVAGPAVLERLAALFGKPIIFDFDDAIFMLHTTEANRRFGWLKFPGKTATICRLSTHIVAGNSFLADYAQQYNSQVSIIPTSIDTQQYRPMIKNYSNGRVIVGWTGSSTSQTHLEMFVPVLREAVARFNVEIRVISDREPVLPGIPFIWRRWSPESEVEEVSSFDIGIMPMPDDKWARGKCALKALQYMAMGIPAICSAVGANCEVIRHGENGLLASTTEEWIENLRLLINDAALRRKLGEAGQQTIEQQYSAHKCAELFARVVRQTVDHRVEDKEEITVANT
jgi:glycosyltransferase involved in cell wall biosynthesis